MGGAHTVSVIFIENEILNLSVCVSLHANTHEKVKNPSIPPTSHGIIVEQL